jgi:hypothetical protein
MSKSGRTRHEEESERMRQAVQRKSEEARARSEQESLAADDRPPETFSVRARSSGHKQKTADKWNQ